MIIDECIAMQDADILITSDPVISPGAPYTQHSGGCGDMGDHIIFPEKFFTNWNNTLSKFINPGKLFVIMIIVNIPVNDVSNFVPVDH